MGSIYFRIAMVGGISMIELLAGTRDVVAQSLAARSPEMMVNSTTNGEQVEPRLALGANSEVFVVWEDMQDPPMARGALFSADGGVLRAEFLINSYTAYPCGHSDPSIALGSCGNFLLAWTGVGGPDGTECAVQVQLFSGAGTRIPPQIQVSAGTGPVVEGTSVVWEPSSKSYWVFWKKGVSGLQVAILDEDGQVVVPASTFGHSASTVSYPRVAAGGDGTVVAVWAAAADGGAYGIYGQRFLASGQLLGGEFTVAPPPPPTENAGNSTVASRSDGSFSVFWDVGSFPESTLQGIAVDPVGFANPIPLGFQAFSPAVATDPMGSYLLTAPFWSVVGGNLDWDIKLALVGQDSSILVDPVLVNQRLDGEQQLPYSGADKTGRVAVTWTTNTTADGDPSGNAIALRLFLGRTSLGNLILESDLEEGELLEWESECI